MLTLNFCLDVVLLLKATKNNNDDILKLPLLFKHFEIEKGKSFESYLLMLWLQDFHITKVISLFRIKNISIHITICRYIEITVRQNVDRFKMLSGSA